MGGLFCISVFLGVVFMLLSVDGLMFSRPNVRSPLRSSPSDISWDLSLKSPCKLNLFLRILGRRSTGYHDLASLFQAISLSDLMYFSKLSSDSVADELICSDKTLSVDKSNLVIKALDLMRLKTGINQHFRVYLDKHVPMQAGLGGGSGNAACAMFAFNKLCGHPGSLESLREWSGDIGSDITFFFTTGTAYCTGRGEIVNSLPPLPDTRDVAVHVFKPREGLSTASVFKALQLDKTSAEDPEKLLDIFASTGALEGSRSGYLINDLEAPAFECQQLLAALKAEIQKQAKAVTGVMMSGSGTSVYALARKGATTPLDVNRILAAFPSVTHFECDFVNKVDDVETWFS